mmetsp:Transcript_13554/g.29470  ORF Transcript_13554/g.29470 Transcript_13554/m.29470 type:complete len:301 (-) Transcript_13554:36-938(-)
MGRRNKQNQYQKDPQSTSTDEDAQEGKHDAFVKCIGDRLKMLGLCSSPDEYSSISEAIASSAPLDALPSEDDLENVTSALLDYFEEVSEDDAKALVYTAASESWGDVVTHITACLNKVAVGGDGINAEIEDDEDGADSNIDEDGDNGDDDGDFIGEGECELCERSIKLTRHHLIPKSTWPRMKKRLWNAASVIESLHILSSQTCGHQQQEVQEKLLGKLENILGTTNLSSLPTIITHGTVRAYLSQVCVLCRQCHSAVHRIHTEWELAMEYRTMEQLIQSKEVMKFSRWANKQRPGRYAI